MYGRYLESLLARNYSKRTVAGREKYLSYFIEWARERDLFQAKDITRPILESYQRHLYRHRKPNGKPLGFSTQRNQLSSLKDYFRWLCRDHYLLANPASEIELPKPEKRLPPLPLSRSEVETLIAQPDINDWLGMRDRAMLELLYSTGIRRLELTQLKLCDVNFERETLAIRQGKGRKDRMLPIGERATHWLEHYLNNARPHLAAKTSEDTFFITSYGEAFNPDVLSRLVGKYIRQADVTRTSGSCHLMRHTMATRMLENGADIRFIQQMLGHAKLDTTEIYTQVSIQQLQKVHAMTHPGAKHRG